MSKTAKTIEKKLSVWQKIHRHRIKIALLLFVILLPIAFVSIVYIGSYNANRKVHFDEVETDQSVFIKSFVSPDEIDALTLDIDWSELKHPTLDQENNLTGGYYTFKLFYTAKANYQVTQVKVTLVLQTPWTDIRSMVNEQAIQTTQRAITVPFNEILPVRPLWFVTVTDPNLYIRVTYTMNVAGTPIEKTAYVMFPLKPINPDRVV